MTRSMLASRIQLDPCPGMCNQRRPPVTTTEAPPSRRAKGY
jgi:hypothetical protein